LARSIDDGEVPHPEVAPYPVVAHGGIQLVEKRIVERPEVSVRDRHLERHPVHALRDAPADGGQLGVPEAQGQREVTGGLLEQARGDHHAPTVDVRREVQCAERYASSRFEIGRLPDAARVTVALLAFQLERARRVIHPQHEPLLVSGLHVLGQLELERDVTAVVRAELLAVEPGGGAPVGGADHEEDAAPGPRCRHGNRPRVPADDGAVRNARQRATPREGHHDVARRRQLPAEPAARFARVRRIELELPGAVQVLPQVPLEVGPGMLGKGDADRRPPSPHRGEGDRG
jgi:hypothetical protein